MAVGEGDLSELQRIVGRAANFGHREHLELAWTYLGRHDFARASAAMGAAIRHIAELHGAGAKYHETLTAAWFQLVAVHRARSHAATFEEFIGESPELMDRQLLERHYSQQLIAGERARSEPVAPDLLKLPTPPSEPLQGGLRGR